MSFHHDNTDSSLVSANVKFPGKNYVSFIEHIMQKCMYNMKDYKNMKSPHECHTNEGTLFCQFHRV